MSHFISFRYGRLSIQAYLFTLCKLHLMEIKKYMEDAVKYEIEVGCFEGVEAVCVIAEHLLAVLVKHVGCVL